MNEAKMQLAFVESHEELIEERLRDYLEENPDAELTEEATVRIVEKCFLEHQIARLKSDIAQFRRDG